jgi:succinoglycan biosynthesis transport protein ExoP
MGEKEIELLRRLAMSRQGGSSANTHSLKDVNATGEASSRGSQDRHGPGGAQVARRSGQAARVLRGPSADPDPVPLRPAMSQPALSRFEQEAFAPGSYRFEAPPATVENELRAALGMLRRRWRMIALAAAVGIVLAAIYAFTATVLFKGTAQVALDPKRLTVLETPDERRKRDDPLFDPARVDSQVEALKSERVVGAVVKNLDLGNDPEFNGDDPSFFASLRARIISLLTGADAMSVERKYRLTVETVAGGLKVTRVENTFVMTIDFLAEKPDRAAQIANAFADAYIQDQLDSNTETSKQAADWLKQRLLELSAQAVKADGAVIDFRRANNIAMADGKSIEDQALADLSAKLTEATAAANDAKARLDQIVAAAKSDVTDVAVPDVLKNEVITKLRQQYLDNSQRATALSARYGKDHGVVTRLRTDNENIRTSIRDETRRLEETYRSEYDVARRREESLRASLDTQFRRTVNVGEVQIKLAELEAAARASRQAYDAAMQRYLQAVQRQSFPVSDARVLSPATPPLKKHLPKRTLVLIIGAFGGALLGFGASIGAELSDRRLRTKRDAEQLTGVQCLGFFPMMAGKPPERATPDKGPVNSKPTRAPPSGLPCDYVVRAPFSVAAEVVRGIKIAADQANDGHGARVIGVISALPGEGKSSIAVNLAHLIAHSGSMTLLVDGDLRSPSLSRLLTPGTDGGLPDVLAGHASRQSVTYNLPPLPLDFIPALSGLDLQHSDGILASAAMMRFLDECRTQYTYVVVDLPPFVPLVDVKAAAHLFDGFALVIEWGVTSREVIGDALAVMPAVWERIFGSVLNKASLRQLKRYGEHVSHYDNKNYFKH